MRVSHAVGLGVQVRHTATCVILNSSPLDLVAATVKREVVRVQSLSELIYAVRIIFDWIPTFVV